MKKVMNKIINVLAVVMAVVMIATFLIVFGRAIIKDHFYSKKCNKICETRGAIEAKNVYIFKTECACLFDDRIEIIKVE